MLGACCLLLAPSQALIVEEEDITVLNDLLLLRGHVVSAAAKQHRVSPVVEESAAKASLRDLAALGDRKPLGGELVAGGLLDSVGLEVTEKGR